MISIKMKMTNTNTKKISKWDLPVSGQMAQFERVCAASFWLTPTRLIPLTYNVFGSRSRCYVSKYFQEYHALCHDILWMVMSSQAPRRCGRWPEYGRRSQPQSLQQPSGHWCLTSHLLFIITFTFFIQLHSSIFSSIFCTLMFGIIFSSLHFSFIFKQFTFT